MDKIIIVISVLIGIIAILFVMLKLTLDKLNEYKRRVQEDERTMSLMGDENNFLRKELVSISNNRREADEKINALHDGDSVNNAISGLCKPKGS